MGGARILAKTMNQTGFLSGPPKRAWSNRFSPDFFDITSLTMFLSIFSHLFLLLLGFLFTLLPFLPCDKVETVFSARVGQTTHLRLFHTSHKRLYSLPVLFPFALDDQSTSSNLSVTWISNTCGRYETTRSPWSNVPSFLDDDKWDQGAAAVNTHLLSI